MAARQGFILNPYILHIQCCIISHPFVILDINTVRLLQVYSIREAAANNLKRLAEEFGPEWAMQHLVPQVCSN